VKPPVHGSRHEPARDSNSAIAVAVATFIDEFWPNIGMWSVWCEASSSSSATPRFSEPTTRQTLASAKLLHASYDHADWFRLQPFVRGCCSFGLDANRPDEADELTSKRRGNLCRWLIALC
jgi:hypothetical protein